MLWETRPAKSKNRIQATATMISLVLCLGITCCSVLHAQNSQNDNGEHNMSGVTDVTGGMQFLLQNDDMIMLQVNQDHSVTTTSVVSYDTNNSSVSNSQTNTIAASNSTGAFAPNSQYLASEAAGRMYNTTTDTIAVLNAVDDGNPAWLFTLFDPQTGSRYPTRLNTSFRPYVGVYTQVVMGDFNGDQLADPLVFYASVSSNTVDWGMKALTASDLKIEGSLTEGPEYHGNVQPVPVTGSIVAGDFNGDGRDEIAMLLTDYQTIAFYQVDPKTLAITPMPDPNNNNQPLTVKLPNLTMVPTEVALAAGRFRQCGGNGSSCPANGLTNADLVVFGQIDKYNGHNADYGYSVIPIAITPNYNNDGTPAGTISATVVPKSGSDASVSTPYFKFPNYHGERGALAQAAPLAYWPQQTNEQLVLGIQTQDGASYIQVGSFVPNGNLDTFDWESETERVYDVGQDYLQNMWVGNFDNQNSDGSHNAHLQIETYEIVVGIFGQSTPHINIFDVNVPSPLNIPVNSKTNWLNQKSDKAGSSYIGDLSFPPRADILVPADIQGRSLRLGAPTIVRITSQIQPDLVLAIPPMHVDWITPGGDSTLATLMGCADKTGNSPCLVNVSVRPSVPPSQSSEGFATSFKFDSSSSSSAQQKSTTSWGISVKESIGESATFNDGMENASLSIKDTTNNAHSKTVSKTYNTYSGTTNSLSATTGFADQIFYTSRGMNVYYYPVLGCNATNCSTDGNKTYVEFSVPDNVTYNNVGGYTQDWYQPVHEPGNVFSYPWNLQQLQARFTDQANPLTTSPTCMAIDLSSQNTNTTWSQGASKESSSGATSSFSNELDVSSSGGGGVSGVDNVDFSASLDIAANTSLNTLNVSTSSLSSSQGITLTKPEFGYTADCCNYAFGQYIFGLKNTQHPASQDACLANQTPDKDLCVAVNDPDNGKQVGVAGTGPIFTGYIANPINNSPNAQLTCSSNWSWWAGVYTMPDVGLSHPQRWLWTKSAQQVSFNNNNSDPNDNPFYEMRGFYISRKPASGTLQNLALPSSPNLALASPSDKLILTTRVYNYSLVNTTAPVHVRFYGQLICASTDNEASCKDWKTGAGCKAGKLCGDSFPIGQDQTIPSIAGFETSTATNWSLANVEFDPVQYPATANGNLNMVFWVVVWMQDGLNLGKEMAGHGLKSIPGSGLTQITQVIPEDYSNNVGMYAVHQPFFIQPATTPAPGATQSGGSALKSISLSIDPQIPLEQRSKVTATLQVTGAPAQFVDIVYYDGDPAQKGTVIDVQKITYMDPNVDYYHRTFFAPVTCGTHTLYARAWAPDTPATQASAITNVTLDPVGFVRALILSTQQANITDATLRTTLPALLNTALQYFQQGQTQAGEAELGTYMQQLAAASGGVSKNSASLLTGQAGVLLGCGTKGFSLSALPSLATVSAGSNASYSIGVTPSGGFSGAVSLTCTGAPQGTSCDVSSQSVTLDGINQSRVTVTVTTSAQPRSAGIAGPIGAGRLKWLLMLLVAVLAIAVLQRGRLRYPILGCAILMMLLSGTGCGSNSSQGTPAGYYPLTIQAASGNTTQIIRVSLHVQ